MATHLEQEKAALIKQLHMLRKLVKLERNKLKNPPSENDLINIESKENDLKERESLLFARVSALNDKEKQVMACLANVREGSEKNSDTLIEIRNKREELVKLQEAIGNKIEKEVEIEKKNDIERASLKVLRNQLEAYAKELIARDKNINDKAIKIDRLSEAVSETFRMSNALKADVDNYHKQWTEKKKEIDISISKHDGIMQDISAKYKDIDEQREFIKKAHEHLVAEELRKTEHIKELYLQLRKESKRRKIEGMIPKQEDL